MPAPVAKRLFDVAEYYRMADAGILHEDDRVELIEGEVVEKGHISCRHAACVKRAAELFRSLGGRAAIVSVQDPIRLSDNSEPQPDLALLKRREDFYAKVHPGPSDVLLIVEISETSEEYDRDTKVPLYARSGIPEVWLVKLMGNTVVVYSQLRDGAYQSVREFRRGQTLSPGALPNLSVTVEAILG